MSDAKPAAFRAVFSDWRLIKTRSTIQLVFEIPVEQADEAYEVLGGMPIAAKERWFGIAALAKEVKAVESQPVLDKPQAGTQFGKREKRGWNDMQPAQQAGIRCDEPAFTEFLKESYAEEWRETDGRYLTPDAHPATCVRMICGITSRSELGTNQKARAIWHQLDDQYQAWIRVGA